MSEDTLCKCGRSAVTPNTYSCKACHAEYMKERRKRLATTPEGQEKILRERARSYANVYLRRGKLRKTACKCGSTEVTMYHRDVHKPLEVSWLCKSCLEAYLGWRKDMSNSLSNASAPNVTAPQVTQPVPQPMSLSELQAFTKQLLG